jgi:hypothetical protein
MALRLLLWNRSFWARASRTLSLVVPRCALSQDEVIDLVLELVGDRHRYHGVLAPNARPRERVIALGRDDGEAPGDTATPAGHQLSPQASTAEANAGQPVKLVPRAADRGGGEHRRGLLERRGRGEP